MGLDHLVRALQGAEAVDDAEDLLGCYGREALLGHDRLDELALGARRVRKAENQGQRELALPQVGENGLDEVRFLRGVVQKIVLVLERYYERQYVIQEALDPNL